MKVTKPIRVVEEALKGALLDHLLRLSISDRYLRFCSPVSNSSIAAYVERLDLKKKDFVFVVFGETPAHVCGMLHVAPFGEDSAEFAISVDDDLRKQGIGDTLFERGLLHCESVGIKHIYMNCLATNQPIKRMAARRDMTIVTDYGESVASLNLNDANSIQNWLSKVQSDTIALYDTRCKFVREQWNNYIEEVHQHLKQLEQK